MLPALEAPALAEAQRPIARWRGVANLLRPHQWTKNGFCLAGAVFGTRFFEGQAWLQAIVYFLFFCAASSCMYVLNDLQDIERDRAHPKKRFRPLAAGQVRRGEALLIAVALGAIAVSSWFVVDMPAFGCLVAYVAMNLIYTRWLKHQPILDVAVIAFGFVLRMLGGVYAVEEMPTTWITLCTFFLALFLGFAKRRAELADMLEVQGGSQRPVLFKYNLAYLDSLLNSTATMTILTYALFTTGAGKNPTLVITVPIVYVAIMQYKLLVSNRQGGEEPDRIILRDRSLQFWVLLWLAAYLGVVNSRIHLFK